MLYKITKTYRNAVDVYYIELGRGEEIDDEMLESIGDATEGGHSYGYSMEAVRIRKLPVGTRLLPRRHSVKTY